MDDKQIPYGGLVCATLLVLFTATGCLIGYERVFNTRSVLPGLFTVVEAHCPTGKKVLGGGFHITGVGGEVIVVQSFPQVFTDATGNIVSWWQLMVLNTGTFPTTVTSYATCAR